MVGKGRSPADATLLAVLIIVCTFKDTFMVESIHRRPAIGKRLAFFRKLLEIYFKVVHTR